MLDCSKLQVQDRPAFSLAHSGRSAKQLIYQVSFISLASCVYGRSKTKCWIQASYKTGLLSVGHIRYISCYDSATFKSPPCSCRLRTSTHVQTNYDQYHHGIVPCARPTSVTEHQRSSRGGKDKNFPGSRRFSTKTFQVADVFRQKLPR